MMSSSPPSTSEASIKILGQLLSIASLASFKEEKLEEENTIYSHPVPLCPCYFLYMLYIYKTNIYKKDIAISGDKSVSENKT